MKSLLYLSFLKVKGTVRNQFRTPASALITIFLILLYGGLVIMAFVTSSDNPAAEGTIDTNTAVADRDRHDCYFCLYSNA